MKSTRRLTIEKNAHQTVIRYQWCQTSVRYALALFLVVAVTILVTDHGGRALSLKLALEITWAAMALGLVLLLAINSTEVRVTPEEVQRGCLPVRIYPHRTFPRAEIVAIHHWAQWRKGGIRHRLALQLAYPVQLGTLDTSEEARVAAEAIAQRLQLDCRQVRPSRGLDMVHLGYVLRIAGYLAAPLSGVILLEFFEM